MANVLDYEIIGSGFELQSSCYIHFLAYAIGKGMS